MNHAEQRSEDYFNRLMRLISLEAEAEKDEMLKSLDQASLPSAESSGNSLIHLTIREQNIGLAGRILLTFGKRNQNLSLPWTRISSGSPVILTDEKNTNPKEGINGLRGVVHRLQKESIEVLFNEWPGLGESHSTFRLDRSTDEISRIRQRHALENAKKAVNSRLAILRDILLGKQIPTFHEIDLLQPLDPKLNISQKQAVSFALSADDIAIIHGPPGTGKTTTLIEIIRQLTRIGQTILVVAPSNLAVDNLLERLISLGENAIRLGHPARVSPQLREHTLDMLAENQPDVLLSHKLMRAAFSLLSKASKYTRAKPAPGTRQALRQEAREMLKEARKLEEQGISTLLEGARIVCATATGLDNDILRGRSFDWCVMDEASQCTEPAAWIPLQFADHLILAGDHFQLPPTVVSPEALFEGFNVSLMERLLTDLDPKLARLLTTQYRMHKDIMEFSSQVFYDGSLLADSSVRNGLLISLPGVTENELTNCAIHFIDTAGASYDEEVEINSDSHFNRKEAELVVSKLISLRESGLSGQQIAVITPYSAQVRLLREKLVDPEIEIDSVDGFQGREKEAVIVSMVRSNRDGEIGFLSDIRRMNVALTRARRKLIVIGDSATISAHPFYQKMLAYFEGLGAYHSIWEEYQG